MADDLELLPVLELEPGRYEAREYPTPQVSFAEDPAGWEAHWKRCLTDAGITTLNSVPGAGWMVSVRDLTDPAVLRKILQVEKLQGAPAPDPSWDADDFRSPLVGGFVLRTSGRVLVSPQCCGDLANLQDWGDAARCRESGWKALWIGHPTVSVRYSAPTLEISDYHEPGPPIDKVRATVDPGRLAEAVEEAARVLREFKPRLMAALRDLRFPEPETVAEWFVGEHG